jgi:hypothetical protein
MLGNIIGSQILCHVFNTVKKLADMDGLVNDSLEYLLLGLCELFGYKS